MTAHDRMIAIALLVLPLTTVRAESAANIPTTVSTGVSLIGAGLHATDLDRSIKFYTIGLGMTVAAKLVRGSVTEVMLSFNDSRVPPVIMLLKDETPGKSPPIEHGNGFSRMMLRVPDAAALAARLSAAGYAIGELKADAVDHTKVFWVEDPDGYIYEIIERPVPRS